MSHYDSYGYDRSDRLFDERDPYGGAAVGYADRGIKRQRSHTPAYDDDVYHNSSEREWEHKRRRSREGDWGSTAERSPERGRRSWNDLDPEEKEREWRMYERERDVEKEWDRYYAGRGAAEEREPRSRSHREGRHTPEDEFRNAEDSLARENGQGGRPIRPTDSLKDPMDSRSILTFKRYAQLLRENGKEPVASSNSMEATQLLYEKYQEYRKAFQRRAMEQFFEAHKNAPWFKEKFGVLPEEEEARAARRRQGRNGKRKVWLNDLRSGALDKINFDVIETREPRNGQDSHSAPSKYLVATNQAGEREEIDDADSAVLPPESNQLLIRSIPSEIGRSSIEEVLKGEEGFSHLALGEPHPLKRYGRVGCAVFEHQSADSMLNIASRLSQTTIEGQRLTFELANRPAQVKLRIAPEYACSLPRLLHDLHQARQALQLFESDDRQEARKAGNAAASMEEEIDLEASDATEIEQRALHVTLPDGTNAEEMSVWLSNALDLKSGQGSGTDTAESDDAINKALLGEDAEDSKAIQTKQELLRKNLDLHIDLLRKVYNCDYYSSTVSDFPEELARRVPRCLRYNCAKPMTHLSAIAEKAKLWASNVDTKHELLMRPDDSEIGKYGGIDIKAMLIDLAAPYSRQDEAEKHRCIVKVNGEECGKPFKAQIFVQKHVTNKHKDWFNELMADKIDDARFYNNYVRDPQRPMPVVQPPERNGGTTIAAQSALGSRLGGYDQGAVQVGAGGNGYYGSGNLVRLGLSSAAAGVGDYSRDRFGDSTLGGGSLRMGAITSEPSSTPNTVPSVTRVQLDPRAAMAPKSYRDLDAGVPSGAAEIELEY